MNPYTKIRAALEILRAQGMIGAALDGLDALAELEKAAAEPACIVESARIEGPTICRRLMWMREVGAGEKLYTTPPPAQPAPKFEAPEVDDEIARKLWREWFDAGCMTGLDTARFWLRVWQRELGPTLGLVEIREPTPEECERIDSVYASLDRTSHGRAMFNAVRNVMWPKEGL